MPIVPGSIPGGSLNRTLSKFPKILFLNEDALAIVKSEASVKLEGPFSSSLSALAFRLAFQLSLLTSIYSSIE